MLFSVIVPVYNTEVYLPRCIDSILSQSFSDFELLLINDGSKDSSGKISEEYAEKDSRVRVFQQKNRGASSARNVGLDNAKGEWICFVDSDDFIEPIYFDTLSQIADKADITYFPIKKISQNGDIILQIPKVCKVQGRAEVEQQLARLKYGMQMDVFGWTCNKVFRADIIQRNSIRFPEDVIFREDEIFTRRYSRYTTSLEIIDIPLYNYHVLQGSLTLKGMADSDYLALSDHLLENLPFFHNEQLLSEDKRRIIDYRLQYLWTIVSISKYSTFFPTLYGFSQLHKELLSYSSYPRLTRLLTYPYWISSVIIFLDIFLKSIIRKRDERAVHSYHYRTDL